MDAVLAGHSHIFCFGGGWSPDDGSRLVLLKEEPIRFYLLEAPWPRGSDFTEVIGTLAAGKHVVLSWSGYEYSDRYLFASEGDFDFVCSEAPALPLLPGAALMPEALVEGTLAHYEGGLDWALGRLKSTPIAGLSVLGPPPPKGNDEKLRALVREEAYFVSKLEEIGKTVDDFCFAAPLVRLKLWTLLGKIVKRVAARHAVRYIEPPAAARDAEGFLREEYWSGDVTHANAAYGTLYLADIEDALRADLASEDR